jgi:hypothetical protein
MAIPNSYVLNSTCSAITTWRMRGFAASTTRDRQDGKITNKNQSYDKLPNCYFIYIYIPYISGHAASGAVGWGTALQAGRSLVRFPMVSLDFFIDTILPGAIWPWGRLSLQQKWVPGLFPGGKDDRCVGLTTLPPSCVDCLEIWEPQTPGTLRACPGL